MKLSTERATALVYEGEDPEHELTVVDQRQVDTGRWVSIHELIVADRDGRYWRAVYSRGLTEYQDIEPFEDDEEAEFTEVEKYSVITYEFRDKK